MTLEIAIMLVLPIGIIILLATEILPVDVTALLGLIALLIFVVLVLWPFL